MPTTTNFGWTTPADTDLVKDGAAAIRTLGNGVDTSFLDLKGGTSGQILAKNSNTDLDFVWVANQVGDITEVQAGTGISVASGSGPIPVITNTVATAFDATGDLVYGTGADTFTKLSVGTAGQVLTVNSGATAPEWASPGGGMTLLNSGGTSLSGASTTVSFTSTGYVNLQIQVKNATFGSNENGFSLRMNGDTGSNYSSMRYMNYGTSPTVENSNQITQTDIIIANRLGSDTTPKYKVGSAVIDIFRPTDTDYCFLTWDSSGTNANVANTWYVKGQGIYDGTAAITSITLLAAGGSFSTGTIYVYGVK